MRHSSYLPASVVSFLLISVVTSVSFLRAMGGGEAAARRAVTHGSMPLLFTENAGQWTSSTRFACLRGSESAQFNETGFTWFRMSRSDENRRKAPVHSEAPAASHELARWTFVRPSPALRIAPGEKDGSFANFYLGQDTATWREGVANYRSIRYRDVWPGIDVEYRAEGTSLLQTFVVRPGADVRRIRLRKEGGLEALSMPTLVEAYTMQSGVRKDVPLSLRRAGGDLAIAAKPKPDSAALTVVTIFASYFGGGAGFDAALSLLCDSTGAFYFSGYTTSFDFPVKNPFQKIWQPKVDAYLAKFACDGKTLLFSTFFGGLGEEWGTSLAAGNESTIWMAGSSNSADIPVTPDAIETQKSIGHTPFLARFSGDGRLLYSTTLLNRQHQPPCAISTAGIATDRQGRVYLAASGCERYDYFEHGGAQTSIGGSFDAYLLCLSPDGKNVEYGTYLGGKGQEHVREIEVDAEGCAILTGMTDSPDFPQKRAICERGDDQNIFLVKFSPHGDSLVYASLFPADHFWSGDDGGLAVDESNRVAFTMTVSQNAVPYKNPLPFPGSQHFVYLAVLSEAGDLMFGSPFGGNGGERDTEVTFDKAGNVHLRFATLSSNLPLVHPLPEYPFEPDLFYYTVIDPLQATVLFATYLGGENMDGNGQSPLKVDSYGYATLVGCIASGALRPVEAFQSTTSDMYDAFFMRLYLPFLEKGVTSELRVTQQLRYDVAENRILKDLLHAELIVRNSAAGKATILEAAELRLPPQFSLASPLAQLVQYPKDPSLPTGTEQRFVWDLRCNTMSPFDSSFAFESRVTFSHPDIRQSCPLPFTRAVAETEVEFVRVPPQELVCTLTAPDSLLPDASGLAYDPAPYQVQCLISNIGKGPSLPDTVRLYLPGGEAIAFAKGDSAIRIVPALLPNASWQTQWSLVAAPRSSARTAHLAARTTDAYDVTQAYCEAVVYAPPLYPLQCSVEGAASASYNVAQGGYTPDPLFVYLTLENVQDTIAAGVYAEIDLSAAPQLALGAGDDGRRLRTYIEPGSHAQFPWPLSVRPSNAGDSVQTIAFTYGAATGPKRRGCVHTVTLHRPKRSIECVLNAIDSVSTTRGGPPYLPSPVPLDLEIHNSGQLATAPLRATLTLQQADGIGCLDLLTQSVPAIAPSGSANVRWQLSARTSRFARSVVCTVTVRDDRGAIVSECETRMFYPGMDKAMSCGLTLPDSLRYDIGSNRHSPDPLPLAVTLGNFLDTAVSDIVCEIDLSEAPHLALSAGEAATKLLPTIEAQRSGSATWLLGVSSVPWGDVQEIAAVRYRQSDDSIWMRCERSLVIEGRRRVVAAACAARGHDTVWADVRYERVIPHPVQVQYTIVNTGNVPLRSCSAAIIHSPMFTLVNAADSVQVYPDIAPGASEAREWLLEPVQERVRPGTDTIRWKWSCDELGSTQPCTHTVTMGVASPEAVVYSPWLLRFRAAQNSQPPPAQELRLWPGGMRTMPWQVTAQASWLDALPASGSDSGRILIRPTTTMLASGRHRSRVDLRAQPGVSPSGIEVIYDISAVTAVETATRPLSVMLEPTFPNPATGIVALPLRLPHESLAAVSIYDVYGRLVASLFEGTLPAGRTVLRFDTGSLTPGLYLCRLDACGTSESRVLLKH